MPDSRSFKGASWPERSCPSALRWMLLRRRCERVRAREERLDLTAALESTQLVRASSQSWMMALLASYPSYAARVSPGVTGVSSISSKRCFPYPAMMAIFSQCSRSASNW